MESHAEIKVGGHKEDRYILWVTLELLFVHPLTLVINLDINAISFLCWSFNEAAIIDNICIYFFSLALQPQFGHWPTSMKLCVSLRFSRS
jgi:hypothetical protein